MSEYDTCSICGVYGDLEGHECVPVNTGGASQVMIESLNQQIKGMYESHSNKCSQYEDRVFKLQQRIAMLEAEKKVQWNAAVIAITDFMQDMDVDSETIRDQFLSHE